MTINDLSFSSPLSRPNAQRRPMETPPQAPPPPEETPESTTIPEDRVTLSRSRSEQEASVESMASQPKETPETETVSPRQLVREILSYGERGLDAAMRESATPPDLLHLLS